MKKQELIKKINRYKSEIKFNHQKNNYLKNDYLKNDSLKNDYLNQINKIS